MSEEKIYVGNGKEIQTKHGSIIKLNFSPDDVKKFNDAVTNGGWVNLDLHKRKEVSAKGQTHYLTVDTWKPSESKAPQGNAPDLDDGSDLPF